MDIIKTATIPLMKKFLVYDEGLELKVSCVLRDMVQLSLIAIQTDGDDFFQTSIQPYL